MQLKATTVAVRKLQNENAKLVGELNKATEALQNFQLQGPRPDIQGGRQTPSPVRRNGCP